MEQVHKIDEEFSGVLLPQDIGQDCNIVQHERQTHNINKLLRLNIHKVLNYGGLGSSLECFSARDYNINADVPEGNVLGTKRSVRANINISSG